MTEIKIAIKNIHSILDTICPQSEKSIFDRNIAKKPTMYQYNI